MVRTIFFTPYTGSKVTLFWRHPHRRVRSNIFLALGFRAGFKEKKGSSPPDCSNLTWRRKRNLNLESRCGPRKHGTCQDGASVERAVCLFGSHQLLAKQTSKSQAFVAHSWDNPPGGSQVVGGICPPAPSALFFCGSLGPWSTQHVAAFHTQSGLFIILESHLSLYRPTLKKAEHRRIDAFKLWCWRRLLRAPWTARRSNQSILKEINPEYSLEGLMLKLKLRYFGHLMRRADTLEKTLMLGKIEGGRRRQ